MKMNITLCSLAALAITMSSWTSTAEAHGVARKNSHKRMVHEKRQQFSGQATFYNTETGNAGACGRYLKNTEYVVAVNSPQYNQAWCGKTITITANGKSHTATIEDECPGDGTTCKWGALDLSPALFRYFADESAGVFDMSWSIGGGGGGGNIIDNVVSSVTGGNKNKGNNNKQSSNNDNDDDEAEKQAAKEAEAQKQAAASKAAAEASRSSASAAAYASSTSAAAAASESRASASSAARASATSAAAASSSSSAAAESRSEASESRASVKAAKSSSSAAAASASVEAARPKNIENFDALFGGLQQLAMAAQA